MKAKIKALGLMRAGGLVATGFMAVTVLTTQANGNGATLGLLLAAGFTAASFIMGDDNER